MMFRKFARTKAINVMIAIVMMLSFITPITASAPVAQAKETTKSFELISRNSDGEICDGLFNGDGTAMSANGRYIAFYSDATNMGSPWPGVYPSGLYLYDRQTRTVKPITIDANGDPIDNIPNGVGGSYGSVSFSADGSRLIYGARVGNNGGAGTIYLYDIADGYSKTMPVDWPDLSPYPVGGQRYLASVLDPQITADGSTIVIALSNGQYNRDVYAPPGYGIYTYNIDTQETERIDLGTKPNGDPVDAGLAASSIAISANGRYISFCGGGVDLPGRNSSITLHRSAYVYDRETGDLSCESMGVGGALSNGYSAPGRVSDDGRYVVVASTASNLVPNDTNGMLDLFLRDRVSNTTTRINVGPNGEQSNGSLSGPRSGGSMFPPAFDITPDGRYVAFGSSAKNLSGLDDSAQKGSVFLYDRTTNSLSLVDITSAGVRGNQEPFAVHTSDDGSVVCFTSQDTALVPGANTNGKYQVFVRTLSTTVDVTFDPRNGASTETTTIPINTAVSEPTPGPQKDDHVFLGWFTDPTDGDQWNFGDPVEDDMTLYAHWDVAASTETTLTISKEVVGSGAPSTDTFDFTVTLSATGTYNYTGDRTGTITSGGTITLAAGESVSITGIPAGSTYSITEATKPNYTPVVNPVAGTISAAEAAHEVTSLVSLGSSGTGGDSFSTHSSISPDGRYISFISMAENLTSEPTSGMNLFLFDTQTQETTLVSKGASGHGGNSLTQSKSSFSANGRYLVFSSWATDLTSDTITTPGANNVYRYDIETGETVLVSKNGAGQSSDKPSLNPAISADGNLIVYHSHATNLVSGTSGTVSNILLTDISAGTTTLVTPGPSNTGINNSAYLPTISADGSRIAFSTSATDVISPSTNGNGNVFLYDVAAKTTQLITKGSGNGGNGASTGAALSADGSRIAFVSAARDLTPTPPSVLAYCTYYYDVDTNETIAIGTHAPTMGATLDQYEHVPSISSDGRYVAFPSFGTSLILGITTQTGKGNIYRYDATTGALRLVSTGASGTGSNNFDTYYAGISADGSKISYVSDATNLIQGLTPFDSNRNVYLWTFTDAIAAENTAAFTNVYQAPVTGELTVSKTVTGLGADPEKNFTFALSTTDGTAGPFEYSKTGSASTVTTGTISVGETFALKHNEKLVVSGLPTGKTYAVTEDPESGYTPADGATLSRTITTAGAEAAFTNAYHPVIDPPIDELDPPVLIFTKTVDGVGADLTKAFEFTVTLSAPGSFPCVKSGEATTTISSGDTITLTHGQSFKIGGLPEGTNYSFTETLVNNYTPDHQTVSGVTAGETTTATMLNTYQAPNQTFKKMPSATNVAPGDTVDYTFSEFSNTTGKVLTNYGITDLPPQGLDFVSGKIPAFTNGAGLTYSVQYRTNQRAGQVLASDLSAESSQTITAPSLAAGEYLTALTIAFDEVPVGFGAGDEITFTFRVASTPPARTLINRATLAYDTDGGHTEIVDPGTPIDTGGNGSSTDASKTAKTSGNVSTGDAMGYLPALFILLALALTGVLVTGRKRTDIP